MCLDAYGLSPGGPGDQWLLLGTGGGWPGTGVGRRHTFPFVLLKVCHAHDLKPFYLEKFQVWGRLPGSVG